MYSRRHSRVYVYPFFTVVLKYLFVYPNALASSDACKNRKNRSYFFLSSAACQSEIFLYPLPIMHLAHPLNRAVLLTTEKSVGPKASISPRVYLLLTSFKRLSTRLSTLLVKRVIISLDCDKVMVIGAVTVDQTSICSRPGKRFTLSPLWLCCIMWTSNFKDTTLDILMTSSGENHKNNNRNRL